MTSSSSSKSAASLPAEADCSAAQSVAGWRPIESAPRDGTHILLWGRQEEHEGLAVAGPLAVSGYWDAIDGSWCSTGSTWTGPFYTAAHWMPLPAEPARPLGDRLAGEGQVLVPREPTEVMLRAGYEAQTPKPGSPAYGFAAWATWDEACQVEGWRDGKAAIYRAMIGAASSEAPPLGAEHEGATELERLAQERDQFASIASDREGTWLSIARGESERADRLMAALSLAAYGLEKAATHHECATCEARAAVARDTLSSEDRHLGSEPPCDEGNPATDEPK